MEIVQGTPSDELLVDAGYRGRGIATALIGAANDHLVSLGCTRAILHASDAGRSVYARAGFAPATEMRLPLGQPADC